MENNHTTTNTDVIDFADLREDSTDVLKQCQIIQLRLLKIFAAICDKHNLDYWLDWGTLLGAVRHQGFIPWDDDVDLSISRKDYLRFLQVAPQYLPADVFMQNSDTDEYYSNYNVPCRLVDRYSSMYSNKKAKWHQGIYIDIFPCDKAPTNRLLQILQQKLYKWVVMPGHMKSFRKRTSATGLKILRNNFYHRVAHMIGLKRLTKFVFELGCKKKYVWRSNIESAFVVSNAESTIFPVKKLMFEGASFSVPNDYDLYLTIMYGNYMQLPPEEERKPGHGCTIEPFIPYNNHKESLQWKNRKKTKQP